MIVATSGGDEYKRRQRMPSIAIGFALVALVVLFYVATIVRLGPNALKKDGGFTSRPPVAQDATKQAPK